MQVLFSCIYTVPDYFYRHSSSILFLKFDLRGELYAMDMGIAREIVDEQMSKNPDRDDENIVVPL